MGRNIWPLSKGLWPGGETESARPNVSLRSRRATGPAIRRKGRAVAPGIGLASSPEWRLRRGPMAAVGRLLCVRRPALPVRVRAGNGQRRMAPNPAREAPYPILESPGLPPHPRPGSSVPVWPAPALRWLAISGGRARQPLRERGRVPCRAPDPRRRVTEEARRVGTSGWPSAMRLPS